MITDRNKNHGLNDQYSIISQVNRESNPEKDDDKEKELDAPSQPAEEHLITEADDLHNNDLEQNSDESSLADPDQEPEEIDPPNHSIDFQIKY